MKFVIALLLTALLSFAGALFFDWWIFAIAAFVVGVFIPQRPFTAFITGFVALFILWGGQAFLIDGNNNHLLSAKVAAILPLGGSYIAIIVVCAVVAGLVAGFAALTGSFLHASITG